jgi:hypothetical protein
MHAAGEVLFCSPSALDCSPALQAALDWLPLWGGRVSVAPGSYPLSSGLVLRDKHGVHLCGACRGQQGPHQGGTVLRCVRARPRQLLGPRPTGGGQCPLHSLHPMHSGRSAAAGQQPTSAAALQPSSASRTPPSAPTDPRPANPDPASPASAGPASRA